MSTKLFWLKKDVPEELRSMLKTLGESYPIIQGTGKGVDIFFEKVDQVGLCEVKLIENRAEIKYSTPAQASRALGAVLSGLIKKNKPYSESTPFLMLGIMLDCSRNAVMTVDHIKIWMKKLVLLGYNTVMLYTEETYELPGEPYFGYQRGAYTTKELKEIDAYAAKLNIEVIPCIQTLGHLAHLLKHHAYHKIKDTANVMLVGEPETYKLIEKMIKHWKSVCKTDRVHIGMDETHDMGRGRYLDLNGYKNGFDLFNEHLNKVVEICRKYDLKPMIWSDMYFRLGSKNMDYYDKKTKIPKEVIKKIPEKAELVYWDYYHDNKEFYIDWIKRHRKMGKEPLMGSGIWTWNKYWYDYKRTESTAGPCVDACYETKLKELFFTQWGDNGAYCDHDSAFAGMVFCADKSYGNTEPLATVLEKRFAAVCGGSYKAHILAGDIHGGVEGFQPNIWEDPFYDRHFRSTCKNRIATMVKIAEGFKKLASKLKKHIGDRETGDLKFAYSVAKAFAERYALTAEALVAYRKKDKVALKRIQKNIPKVVESVMELEEAYRTMWLNHNKPEGLDVLQGRFGMIEARYREMSRSIYDYINGNMNKIVEFECKCLP
jgi:hexosaminidase